MQTNIEKLKKKWADSNEEISKMNLAGLAQLVH